MNILARARLRAQPQPVNDAITPTSAALAPSAIQRGLRLSIIEGSLSNIHINITAGAFLTGFALLLGAGEFELGLLGALPFVGQLFQFVGAYLEERMGQRRRLVMYSAGLSRSLWALMAMLPFLGSLGGARLPIFLLLLAASQALIGITANAWMSWMSDLVPPRQRGRYFGVRNTICSITAMVSTWAASRVLDHYHGTSGEALGYLLIFGAAVIAAIAGVVVLAWQPEPPVRRRERVRIGELFSAPLRHSGCRTLSLTAAGWAIVTGIAGPFFNVHGLQYLQLSFTTLGILTVITSAVALVSQPLVGRLQDRYGDKRVLVVSVVGVVLLPLGWVFATPSFMLPLWLNAIFSGVFWPGINQGLVNLLMDRAPAEGRGAYVACYGAITGAGTFAAGLLGAAIATNVGPQVIDVGAFTLTQYTILFILSSLGRLLMAFVFARKL